MSRRGDKEDINMLTKAIGKPKKSITAFQSEKNNFKSFLIIIGILTKTPPSKLSIYIYFDVILI